jgi:hypothetical protein
MMREVLAQDSRLARFSGEQKRRLFDLWSTQEPRDALRHEIAAHPEWRQFAWLAEARDYAARNDFAQAWQLVRQYASPPVLPPISVGESIDALEQELYAHREDYGVGYALYRAQMDAGKPDDALDTVRHFTGREEAPAYFNYLEAEAWAAKQDWERAWQAWQEYKKREPR